MAHADAAVEEEVSRSIGDAEQGDLDGITSIITRGDGHLLVGRSSNDEETQQFLDKVPELLVRTILCVHPAFYI